MKKLLFYILVCMSGSAFAELKLDLAQLQKTEQQLISSIVLELPKKFENIDNLIKIRTKNFRKNNRLGLYNDLTKTISLSPSAFKDLSILKKTLFHELAHAYEFRFEKIYQIEEYQLAAGLHKRGFGPVRFLKQQNYLESASADSYEYKNHQESFPVNFEFFMLDPEFQCRKPLLFSFFKEHFQHDPFKNQECVMVDKLPVNVLNQLIYEKIDFSKLYQVHYLFADKGVEAMSRWGHSMIRMVFCAPEKSVMDETCLKDITHHWVISFRANVQDIEINNIKGMLGKYPSEIFIFPMLEIIKEYNKTELRDLISLPIKTNAHQLERFKQMSFEKTYAYKGKYRFFTVNCATETLDFFKLMMNEKSLYELDLNTPLALLRKLKTSPLFDGDKIANLEVASDTGHYFKAQTNILVKSFEKIQNFTDSPDLNHYLEKTTAAERKSFFQNISVSSKIWASILFLENQISAKFQKEFMEDVAKLVVDILDNKKVPVGVSHLEELRLNYLENNNLHYDWKGYGIPFKKDFVEPQYKISNLTEDDVKKTQEWIASVFPNEKLEVDLINNNIQFFSTELKSSIRSTK
jgi:hypothetical protein